MLSSTQKVYHPQLLIYIVNVLAWLLILESAFFDSILSAVIMGGITFIPATILVGTFSYFVNIGVNKKSILVHH
jgi:F0F1-type ATP synthase assembly protein I